MCPIAHQDEICLRAGGVKGIGKYHTLGKSLKQAEVAEKINNEKATMLVNLKAEISIVDTVFGLR